MKIGMRWMVVAAALVSTCAWAAVWDPDADAALLFNMDFETYNNTTHTATDAEAILVGTLADYNTASPNVFGETGRAGLGYDANFAAVHDVNVGKGVWDGNDVKLKMNPTSLFNLGDVANKHTWTFWFNVPNLTGGSIIRHAYIYANPDSAFYDPSFDNYVWEIRIQGGNLHFYHKNNSLKMQTSSTLSTLGLQTDTWYSAAIVIDRTDTIETSVPTTQLSSKIYVDGLEVPIIVISVSNSSMNIEGAPYMSPLWIGAGDVEFDGLLDDVRLFSRVLTPLEVSLLNQPDTSIPRALYPIPRSSNVIITTDVNWVPADGVGVQGFYFGTDPNNLVLKTGAAADKRTNAELGGPFSFNTTYYWYVRSDDVNGPLWSFTTETGKAIEPSPFDGEEDVNYSNVDFSWYTPTTATYTVYMSTTRLLVENNDVSVRIANGISDPCMNFDPCDIGSRGQIFYWRVNSTYASPAVTIPGNIWSYRTTPYGLLFNTSGYVEPFADHLIPAYGCVDRSNWSTVTTGSLDGNYADGNAIAVFNFPSGFYYDRKYDIFVLPEYRATDIDFNTFPTPLAIHVTGDFYFDGRVQIAGDDITTTTQDITFVRSGGFPGPKHNNTDSVFNNRTVPVTDYWIIHTYDYPSGVTHTRYGDYDSGSDHPFCEPTALAKSTFGPGQPINPPYKGGGGGGAGGAGGEGGRGYYHGIDTRGPSYGDEEIPVPFGGSSGGWGGGTNSPGGAAGGGGIEIVATGSVTLDINSQIIANGGGQLCTANPYPGGGGGGGSVRIIAGTSVTNKGIIDVNGGKGGNGSTQGNNTGGGGGGGRVAIFYGTTYTSTGTITAEGGAKGVYQSTGLAKDGEDGTIFVAQRGASDLAKKTSTPTPKNGDQFVYCNPDPCTGFKLKWYSGYGGTTDVVYCDTFYPPTTVRATVPATRGQHSVTMTVSSGNTYYWKVVTDVTVSSDAWSFKTVKWRCPLSGGTQPHVGGPEWDSNHNCVLDIEDFAYFVEDWVNSGLGDTYFLNNVDFNKFGGEWKQCINRSDGCVGF